MSTLQHPTQSDCHQASLVTEQGRRVAIVVTGHVDHGKSTIVGRLLADTGSLPTGKLEQVRAHCAATARPFEYAFLLDALKDEQAQGITIDAARIFFQSKQRQYVILDAPGHTEFLKNMITGAAHAEAALLVIDAFEGVRENSRRHGFLLSLLGIRQIAVLVNKMDLVAFSEQTFRKVRDEYTDFLSQLGVEATCFVPVSGREGGNVALRAPMMPWYEGPTVLNALDAFTSEPSAVDKPFRMPVQGVYKFTEDGDDRRIIAGTILTGKVSAGDELVFFPSGNRSRVRTVESFNTPPQTCAEAPNATGLTLVDELYVRRGEIAARSDEPKPEVTTRLRVSLFWLGRQPLRPGKDYLFKLGTARVPARIEQIQRVLDASTLAQTGSADVVQRNDVAECVIKLSRPLAFDVASAVPETGRFVLVDDFEIRGGGIIREAIPDRQAWVRDRVLLRNYKWEPSAITRQQRAERFGQNARLILISGEEHTDRKSVARELETRLFSDGRVVYFLGIGNVLYGVDADIGRAADDRSEHMRRLAEVANLMLDNGAILIVTASALTSSDIDIIKEGVDPDFVTTVWLGESRTAMQPDLRISESIPDAAAAERIKALLADQGVIFRPK